jgi:pyruvate dehydrogenase E1 component alpha subunit
MLVLGVDPRNVMAELCGKNTGTSKGKGGSMHMYSKEHNFYGGNGIVGAQVPIGTGLAFSHKYKEDDGIAFVYFGDGAANQGQVYEAFNMASLWKLPAIYILENNRYGMGTSVTRSSSGNDLKTRGDPFGIPTISTDGMDLFDVTEKAKEAVDYTRSGKGPIIIHVDTYRYKGHSMSDPATYRSRAEVDNIKKTRDPIAKVKNKLIEEYKVSKPNLEEIEDEILKKIDEAAQFAIDSQVPSDFELEKDVVVEL